MYKFKLKISILMIAAAFASTAFANHLPKKDKHVNNEIVVSPINHDFEVQLNKYDPALYQLAYQIFLQNNNIKDAFAIAVAAVKQDPNNIDWRHKLLTIATWNAEPVVALDSYLYLATNFKDQNSFLKGIDIARKIHEDEFLAKFLNLEINKGNSSQELWTEYLDTLTIIGELQTAIDDLNMNQKSLFPGFYLTKVIELSHILTRLEDEKKLLVEYRHRLGNTSYWSVKENTINLIKGDFRKSYYELKRASNEINNNDYNFWQTYAPIAWLQNRDSESIRVYKKLLSQEKPADSIFERLVNLYIYKSPQVSYYYANQGRLLYPKNIDLTKSCFKLAAILGKWEDITNLWKVLPEEIRQKLKLDANFWSIMMISWQQKAEYTHFDFLWRFYSVVRAFPNDLDLRAQYINFLVSNNHLEMINNLPPTTNSSDLYLSSELWPSYALAYLHLHNHAMVYEIAQLYKNQFKFYANDAHWLLVYKGFLEQISSLDEANSLKQYAWSIFLQQISKQNKSMDYEQIIDYASLAIDSDPGDTSLSILSYLQKNITPETADLMLSWSLKQENYELADAIYNFYLQKQWLVPPQLALAIALYHQNNYLMHDLIIKHTPELPNGDRIQAAENTGEISLAQSFAYDSLSEQPRNSELYDKYFAPLMLKSSYNFNFNQQYFQYGPEEGPRTKIEFSYPITPGIMLTPYGSVWFLQDIDTTQLATVPDKDLRTGIKALITQTHGNLFVDVGYRDNLDSFATAKIAKTYDFSNDLTGLFTIGYNQQADDTSPLLIGGMKDELSANLNYHITSKDILQGSYYQNLFYTQNGQWLALGQQQTLNYKHLFWESYPDFSMEAYGSGYQYEDRAGTVTGDAASLVPVGTTPDSNFFIPANFIEYGITAEFGQNYHDDYTYRIRPFAAVTLMESTTAGFGTLYNIGIGGSVFGKDHLALYYEEANNQGSGISKERIFEFMYQIYF